jgi:TetR/AcrR family transcriptional regulator, regulator of autoinduction and epiphytic fitness
VTAKKAPATGDGRLARSARTREAIVDVLLDLIDAGEIQPSSERIAELAGVSRRAVFNHFNDREQLFTLAVARHMARVLPTVPPLVTAGSLAERIDGFVASRKHILSRTSRMRRVAFHLEPTSPAIAGRLRDIRAQQVDEVKLVFAEEIKARPRAERQTLTAAVSAAASFTFWDDVVLNQGHSEAQAASAMKYVLTALLTSVPDPSSPPASPAKESL